MKPFKPFKILWDTAQKTKGGKWLYVQTEPEYSGPHAEKLPDRAPRVYAHIAVYELFLKRWLKEDEEVHHKNGNGLDNKIENLELTTHSEHQEEHAKEKKMWEDSPRTKPGRREAFRVVEAFLSEARRLSPE